MRPHTVVSGDSTTSEVRELTLSEFFNVAVPFIDRHLAEGRGDKLAILSARGEVTYSHLADATNRCGNALLGMGIGRGERVVMIIADRPEFFFLFWGAIKVGIVPVPVNTLLTAAELRFIIEDSGCAAVVYSEPFTSKVLAATRGLEVPTLPVEGGARSLASTMADAAPALEVAITRPTDDCFWLYSSGSTGTPKGAVHTHRAMVVSSQRYGVEALGLREHDRCFSAAKLFFAYGMGNGMTFPLWVGGTTVLLEGRPTPATTLETVRRFQPTVYFGVPTLYAAQLRAMKDSTPDLSSLRVCVSAGEALPPDLYHRWKAQTGLEILDGIGSTEILHIFISNREGDVTPGTSGRVVPGYEARVLTDDGAAVPTGEPGRLWIKGDSICKRYHNNPEKTAATIRDGWIDTGDTYVWREDGTLAYCGRNDDMLKVGGIWCSPFEIEARLIEHERVLEAAVIGRADADGLIKPEAYIVLTEPVDDQKALAEELLRHCKAGLAPYKYPRRFYFRVELPKTATGKIQRFKLRA